MPEGVKTENETGEEVEPKGNETVTGNNEEATQAEGVGSNLAKDETGETDWKATSRNWEKQAKKDHAELKKVQEELSQLRKDGGTSGELEELRQQVASLMSENTVAKREAAIAKVASDKKLTTEQVELLEGDTPEELSAHADRLLKAFGSRNDTKEDNSNGRVPKEKLRPGSTSAAPGGEEDPAEIAKAVLRSGF